MQRKPEEGQQAYSFSQAPQPVAARSKYRDPFSRTAKNENSNIMWDRRVYRGNTYAAQVMPLSAQVEVELTKKKEASMKRKRQQAQEVARLEREQAERVHTPDPILGRKHIDIQTEQYLEEIADRVIEVDAFTETDPFMDRPASPKFIPQKSGVDRATQIDDDLFDFDFEVEPILEVLVGKTLEQSMLEVLEEEEMAALQKHQREFEQKRNAELAETQRLEAEEIRRHEEKERRVQQERERLQKEKSAKEKLASRAFAKTFLRNLEVKVFNNLEHQGFFFDVVERQVETDFMPWLMQEVQSNLDKEKDARELVDQLIKSTLKKLLVTEQQAREERHEREEQERQRRIREEEERIRLEQERLEEERRRKEAEELALQEKRAREAAEALKNEEGDDEQEEREDNEDEDDDEEDDE